MSAQPQPLPQKPQLGVVPKPEPPQSSGAKIWLLLIAIVAVAGTAYYLTRPASSAPVAATRTARVRSGLLAQTLRLSGTTAAENSNHLLVPRLPGRRNAQGGGNPNDFQMTLASLGESGTRVNKGDVVAAFDMEMMRTRLDDFRATLLDYQGRVDKAKAQGDVTLTAQDQKVRAAKAKLDKAALDMKTSEVRSAIQAEQYKLAYEQAKAEYEGALKDTAFVKASTDAVTHQEELSLRGFNLEVKRAESNLEQFNVRAPISGVLVSSQMVRNGQLSNIRAGDQARPGQEFLQIADLSNMVVDVRSNQVDVPNLRIGAKATVRFDAFPDLALPATVYSVNPLANSSDQYYVRNVPLRLKLDRTDPRVVPDLSVSADIVIHEQEKAGTIVPRSSIFWENTKPYVFVQKGQVWERRDIELGLMNNIEASVLNGLADGEVVAVEMPKQAAPATTVTQNMSPRWAPNNY